MYSEDQLLPVSALQHLAFCERQCALIHIEQVWSENRLTMEGKQLHDRVHTADDELRGTVRIVRGLRITSLRLGLAGIADVVEFHRQPDGEWSPFPVDYKRGKPKPDSCDEVQLCAQALCLEEMLDKPVQEGAIYYGQPRRRLDVHISTSIRQQTEQFAGRLHALVESGKTPPAVYEKKCEQCSLLSLCIPKTTGGRISARGYLTQALQPSDPLPSVICEKQRMQ